MSVGKASSEMHCDVSHNSLYEALARIGFVWDIEQVEDGETIRAEKKKNMYTIEGLNSTLNVMLGSTAKIPGFYIGLFEGNYTPTINDVAATISAAAVETNAFSNPTIRPQWVASAPAAGGTINNYDNKAVFTFTGTKTIYGGFLIASSAVNSTGGPLLSVVRFASPYGVQAGSVLNVGAGCTISPAV